MKLSGKIGKFGKSGIAIGSVVVLTMATSMGKEPVSKDGPGTTIPESLLPPGSTSDGSVKASVTYTLSYTDTITGTRRGYETLSVTAAGTVTPNISVTATGSGGAVRGGKWTKPASKPGNPASNIGCVKTSAITASVDVQTTEDPYGHLNGVNIRGTATAATKTDTAKGAVVDNP